ncbi:MAG: radical SAM protein [Candidatus Aenigmarchaeota archaeon]|nr:radical SAM protein [Candidatus Aenigmarchaeota archaeon]
MKVTFLIPPAYPQSRAPERCFGCNYGLSFQQPIHILYPAAVLEKAGFDVEFIDCVVQKKSKKWLENYVENKKSDVFVFFTVYLAEKTDIYWRDRIRELNKDAIVIFMGPEPTRVPEKYLSDEKTFVVRGEPEYIILDLMNKIKKKSDNLEGINGLSFMKGKKVYNIYPRHYIDNLDKLPFPARHLIKTPYAYFNPKLSKRPTTTMFTTRQCWGQCIYCIPAAYNFAREIEWKNKCGKKPPMTERSPKNIYEEFKQVKKQGYRSVAIMDDNFMGVPTKGYKERIMKICDLIKPLKMEWGCLARADQLQDEEVLQKMRDSGCMYVDIGVESFDKKVLDYVRKGTTPGAQMNAIILLKKVGIQPKINILLGASPLQTVDDIRWTVKILKMLDIDFVSFGIVAPHPSLEFYKIVKKNKWFTTKSGDWEGIDPYNTGIVDFPEMTHEQLEYLVKWCYRVYYLRPYYIFKRLRNLKSVRELFEDAKIAFKLFFRRRVL